MADRYWRGGSGTWNTTNTANWSATSGGPGGASVPTAADDVFFDSNSAAGTYTVSTSTGLALACRNLTITKPTVGNVTFTDTGVFTVSGSLNITGTGVTWNAFGSWTFNATSAQTVRTDGIVIPVATFNGIGGSWQLLSDFSIGLTNQLTFTNGTLDLNGFNLRCGQFNSANSNVRTLAMGTGVINSTGTGTCWSVNPTNLTITGNRTLNLISTATTGIREVQIGTWTAATAWNVNVTAGTAQVLLTGNFNSINTTGFTGRINAGTRTIYGNFIIGPGTTTQTTTNVTTMIPTGTTVNLNSNGGAVDFPLTIAGVSGGRVVLSGNYTSGTSTSSILTLTSGTLDLAGNAFTVVGFASSGTLAREIIATNSTFTIFGSGITVLNLATITNLTLTGLPQFTFTATGSAGTRTINLGAFTEAQAPSIRVTGGTDVVNLNGNMANMDLTGFGGSLLSASRTVYGNMTLSTTMTITDGVNITTLAGSGTQEIITADRVFNQNVTFAGTGTYRLQGNLNLNQRNAQLNGGTLDLNGFALSALIMNTITTNPRNITFNGPNSVINITGNNATVWGFTVATGFSYTAIGTEGRINFTYSGAVGTRVILHGGVGEAIKAPPMYITGGSDTISIGGTTQLSDLVFTGGSQTVSQGNKFFYGNLILTPSTVITPTTLIAQFIGNGTQIFDSANVTRAIPLQVGSGTSTGTLQLANATNLTTNSNVTVFSGTFNTNSQTVTTGAVLTSGSSTKALNIANSTLFLGNANVAWNANTSNTTVVSTNSNIVLNNDSTANRTFAGGGQTYATLTTAGANVANTIITGNNTFGRITTTKTVAQGVLFTAGSTTTIADWDVVGTASAPVTIDSPTNAQHNLVYSGPGLVEVEWTTVAYSNAAPLNTWYAPLTANNINGGNNTGWQFNAPPVGGGNFFLLF